MNLRRLVYALLERIDYWLDRLDERFPAIRPVTHVVWPPGKVSHGDYRKGRLELTEEVLDRR
jgi:hypothetical protein